VAPTCQVYGRPYMRTDLQKMDRILLVSPAATRWGQKAAYIDSNANQASKPAPENIAAGSDRPNAAISIAVTKLPDTVGKHSTGVVVSGSLPPVNCPVR